MAVGKQLVIFLINYPVSVSVPCATKIEVNDNLLGWILECLPTNWPLSNADNGVPNFMLYVETLHRASLQKKDTIS